MNLQAENSVRATPRMPTATTASVLYEPVGSKVCPSHSQDVQLHLCHMIHDGGGHLVAPI